MHLSKESSLLHNGVHARGIPTLFVVRDWKTRSCDSKDVQRIIGPSSWGCSVALAETAMAHACTNGENTDSSTWDDGFPLALQN